MVDFSKDFSKSRSPVAKLNDGKNGFLMIYLLFGTYNKLFVYNFSTNNF